MMVTGSGEMISARVMTSLMIVLTGQEYDVVDKSKKIRVFERG